MLRQLLPTLLFIFPLTLAADIFMRTPRQASAVLRTLGGAMIYESPVAINGKAGSLSTFVFNETSDLIAHRLAARLKLPPPSAHSAIILDASNKTLCRYFIMKAPDLGNSCIVTVIEQKAAVFRNGNTPPPWPDNIPALNATAAFSAVCEKTGCTFLSAASLCSSPQQAAEEAAAALIQAGWQATLPATPTFRIFTRQRQQCLVFSTENPHSRQITINLLQREGSKQ